ncbi:diguanylate cyclase [Pseudofrankia sp. BMG5.36]|uniref:putative bifunctional diguanylate cyclase/phosphodiesterase n=1 Tax=Pseudofrankia sp. BMG5.36 TaxID=1834512 RepID=UPI0009F613E6|nr:diguanylate cyclase [Pseudofrankia sp. BMG5.36]
MIGARRKARCVALACAAYVLVVTVCGFVFPPDLGEKVAGCAALGACLAAAVCLVWTGWRVRGADRLWRLIIGGATILTAAASTWHVRWIIEHGSALPSHMPWSANAFLVIMIVYLAGVLAFPTDPLDAGSSGFAVGRDGYHWYVITALDSLVVVGSMFLLTWATVLAPAVRTRRLDAPGIVSNTGTVVGYLVLLAAILLLSTFRQPRSGLALALLGAGLGVTMLSTAIYLIVIAAGGHSIAPIVDITCAAGWLLLLLAGLVPVPGSPVPARRGGSPRTLWIRAALPYLALGVAGLMVIGQLIANSAIDSIERGALIGLLLVVLLRQMMTLDENTRLLASVQTSRQQLHYLAFHDPLTGLANRRLFTDRIQQALICRASHPFALVYCDLDDFKRINDTLGHAAGDALLRTTASRLRNGVRSGDTVARLGGDEFAILLKDGYSNPERACQRLATKIRAPTILAGHTRPVGVSLGLVLADDHSPPCADALLRDADIAMYAAKRQGKGGLVVYRPELSTPAAAPQIRADLEEAIHSVDRAGNLEVRYLPVVDLNTGKTVAVDAVPCWKYQQFGELAPDLFTRLADEAGLTAALAGRVLEQVCRDVMDGGPQAAKPVFVSVPMSFDLEQAPVASAVRLLTEQRTAGRAIILSLAETCAISGLTINDSLLQRLAARGVRLALDGVGGNAGSFACWHLAYIEIIRLHPCLTGLDTTPATPHPRRVRDAILAVTTRLDLTAVATAIDNDSQARHLANAGCHLGTGPLYGPPRPLNKIPTATRPLSAPGLTHSHIARAGRPPPIT